MIRYARAIVGSILIIALYSIPVTAVLGAIAMGDCVPTDAQMANGERCTTNSQWLFCSTAVIAFAGLALILAIFLRHVFRRQA